MNHGPDFMEPIARGLYLEIAMIEEQHVTQYESLLDPLETWLEDLVFHKYNEVYMYHSFMEDETEDKRLRQLWELHLNMEIEQLKAACQLLRMYEGKYPEEILPPELPKGVRFQSNKDRRPGLRPRPGAPGRPPVLPLPERRQRRRRPERAGHRDEPGGPGP
jgi:hypothetical protein